MVAIKVIGRDEIARVWDADITEADALERRLALIADMCRLNTLATVKRAGSGHLGSSFSSLDIVVRLYYATMNVRELGFDHPDRDIFFSSKGHDVPALYSVLYALGVLPFEQFVRLRRIDGTCGHPDVKVPGCEANTGSLGMGISKGKGHLLAKRLLGHGGQVYVMTGDGELQEGQIYESLQTAVHQRLPVNVVIDLNRLQSDLPTSEIIDLGDLDAKLAAFGCHVERCDGHDSAALGRAFAAFDAIDDRPKVLIAETIKGRGVSFMEHPQALIDGGGLYRWHAGAPDDDSYHRAFAELRAGIEEQLEALALGPLQLMALPAEERPTGAGKTTRQFVADAYGQALVEVGERDERLVVLDADLSADCRLRGFERRFPDRFVENGIAEQDMVSMAGGLARQGLIPVVNSFAAFLAARANEQIYNTACEQGRVVYALHYAGVLPAGPGQSHQSVRDISLLAALPAIEIIQPCNPLEARQSTLYAIERAEVSVALRLIIGPSPRPIDLPDGYQLTRGRGAILHGGGEPAAVSLFSYGPVMLHEALLAAETLAAEGTLVRVINHPWLNLFDADWLAEAVEDVQAIAVVEDHSTTGGLGQMLLSALVEHRLLGGRRFDIHGVDGLPAWGTPWQALAHHQVDGNSLARLIRTGA